MRRHLFALSVVFVGLSAVSSAQLTETFPDPMIGWTTRWLYQNSNMGNIYVAAGDCDENNRGQNPCGLDPVDTKTCGAGWGGAASCTINFKPDFAATISEFSFDLSTFDWIDLTIFDKDGNSILFAPGVLQQDRCNGRNFAVSSTNGVGGFRLYNGIGHVEGYVGVDNFRVVQGWVNIDFDNLPDGFEVTNRYAEATFSSNTGYTNWTTAQDRGSSLPNHICTGPDSGGINCTQDTFVDFTCPVSNLTLRAVGVNDVGVVARVNVFENGRFTGSVDVLGLGDPSTPVKIDLNAFNAVTRIELVAIRDVGGIGWDDFRFSLDTRASWENYGTGWPGSNGVPALTSSAPPELDSSIILHVGNSLGFKTSAFMLIGRRQVSVPTIYDGTMLVLPNLILPLNIPAVGLYMDTSVPLDPRLCGLSVHLQALLVDPGASRGLAFTEGLTLTFGN